jgi:hypothetical protein
VSSLSKFSLIHSAHGLTPVRARIAAAWHSLGRPKTPTAQEYWGSDTGPTVGWWKAL